MTKRIGAEGIILLPYPVGAQFFRNPYRRYACDLDLRQVPITEYRPFYLPPIGTVDTRSSSSSLSPGANGGAEILVT